MANPEEKEPTQKQSFSNHDGTVYSDRVYTEERLMVILGLSRDQIFEYYRHGLPYFQLTRKQRRQIAGSSYFRFVERMSQIWDGKGEKPPCPGSLPINNNS